MSDQFARFPLTRPACAERHIALVAGAQTLAERCDGIRCRVAGTITITDKNGVALAYDCTAGEVLNFRALVVIVGSGTFYAWNL